MAARPAAAYVGNAVDLRWELAATVRDVLPRGTRFGATARGIDLFLVDGSIIAVVPCTTCYLVAMLIDGRPTTVPLGSLAELKDFLRASTASAAD